MIPSEPTSDFTSSGFDYEFASPADYARLYRLRGIQVVPAFMPAEHKSWKRPLLDSWKDFQEALVSDEVFASWYGIDGKYAARTNMGVITGRASNNLFVIDLDHHKNAQAAAWWAGLMAVHNNAMDLETVEQRTGGGGSQKLYRAPPEWTAPTNKTPIGVDIRGQGGFAMLAPSLHESGRHYEWCEGKSPDDIPVTIAPDWLLEAVEALVAEHGGGITAPRKINGQVPQEQYDGFAHLVDGRETYMRDMVWAAVLNWNAECPLPVSAAMSLEQARREYEVYEREVNPQGAYPADVSKAEALDREGRGWKAFHVKWQSAIRKWDGEVYREARKPGRIKSEPELKRPEIILPKVDPTTGKLPSIQWLDMSLWDSVPVPTRQWAIRDRVPLNQVGLFSGEGGTGKSIVELMKDVAHVVGGDWLGSMPEQGGAFYLGAEDEAEEIHIRLAAIATFYKTTFTDLTRLGLRVLPLLGQDSMLCVQSGRGNHIECTPLYKQLYEAAGDLKPKNISIDTLSRAFGGDEINRVQVYAFAMHMQAIAKVAQGSVTILSHPSLAGMASGSGISGSTAWHGAFRFRQYLKGIKAEDDADPADDDLRELEFKKNQYGPRSRPVILRYKDGLFLPVNGATDPERVAREARAEGCFVNLLRKFRERGDDVSHKPKSQYYAPKLFADETAAKQQGLRKTDFEDALRRLMDGNRVLVEVFSKNSRSQTRLILCPGT